MFVPRSEWEIVRFLLIWGMIILSGGFLYSGIPLLFENLSPPPENNPQYVTAYTDGVLQKNNTEYSFSFKFQTWDEFVEREPIYVQVYATLPDVTADCVKVRFEGGANYSLLFYSIPANETIVQIKPGDKFLIDCPLLTNNELVLYPIHHGTDAYESNQTLTLHYGINGNFGIWYINPQEKKSFADYVPNVIHISPHDVLVQLQASRVQLYLNKLILSLTLIIAGGTLGHLAFALWESRPRNQIPHNTNIHNTPSNNNDIGKLNKPYWGGAPTDIAKKE